MIQRIGAMTSPYKTPVSAKSGIRQSLHPKFQSHVELEFRSLAHTTTCNKAVPVETQKTTLENLEEDVLSKESDFSSAF